MRRWAESHTRQRWTKSTKDGSLLLMSLAMVVAPVAREASGRRQGKGVTAAAVRRREGAGGSHGGPCFTHLKKIHPNMAFMECDFTGQG